MRLRIRSWLHPAAVEFATRLETARFSDARWFTRHVFEASTDILDHLRPCHGIDPKAIEYQRGLDWGQQDSKGHCICSGGSYTLIWVELDFAFIALLPHSLFIGETPPEFGISAPRFNEFAQPQRISFRACLVLSAVKNPELATPGCSRICDAS